MRTVPAVDGHEWLDSYRRRVDEIGARAAQAQAELEAVTATATSSDGAVTLTVNPAGALQHLELGEPAARLSRAQLAVAVLATARQAQAVAARDAARAVGPLLGEHSEAMRVVRGHLPEPATGVAR